MKRNWHSYQENGFSLADSLIGLIFFAHFAGPANAFHLHHVSRHKETKT
jgi:hypothetical protein